MLSTILYGGSIQEIVGAILASLVVIFFVLPFHEYAHGFVAYKLGDSTAKNMGRLKFNPLAHIDPIGAICIVLVGFGWAKPVPINPNNFKKPKSGMAWCALAGPMANILAAIVGAFLINLLVFLNPASMVWAYVYQFLLFYTSINISLAMFNLIPIPPLDGSKILFAFLPDRIVDTIYRYERFFFPVLIILIYLGVLRGPLSAATRFVLQGVITLTGLPFGLSL